MSLAESVAAIRAQVQRDNDEMVRDVVSVLSRIGEPHIGGTKLPDHVIEERARNVLAVLLAGWEVRRRRYALPERANEEEAMAHAKELIK